MSDKSSQYEYSGHTCLQIRAIFSVPSFLWKFSSLISILLAIDRQFDIVQYITSYEETRCISLPHSSTVCYLYWSFHQIHISISSTSNSLVYIYSLMDH